MIIPDQKILKVEFETNSTWYTENDAGGNLHVAMQTMGRCPWCDKGENFQKPVRYSWGWGYEKCTHCGGDGKQVNLFRFNPDGLLCAFPVSVRLKYGLSYGELFEVTALETGKSARVNYVDEGPSEKLYREQDHGIDLTPAAFIAIFGDLSKGIGRVKVRKI